MADYLADFTELVRRGEGGQVKRDLLLRRIGKFERRLKEVGGRIESQQQFVKNLVQDGHGDYKELMRNLCFVRLSRGDFSDWTGWEYRNDWATASYGENPTPRWRLEPVPSIAVLGEQGIGDEIMFGTCIPDLQRVIPEVVYECDPRLVDVFHRSLGIKTKPRQDIVCRGQETIKYLTMERSEAAFIPVGDLPRFFRKSTQSFPKVPFLKPLPEMVEKWSRLKGKVGISWRSRTGQVKPAEFLKYGDVCLQYDAWEYETEGMIVPNCDLRNDVEDILGILANLSRVVSVPQTVVHFSGSIGTPVDVIFPAVGTGRVKDVNKWRYIDPMPWYPNVRVYPSIHAY